MSRAPVFSHDVNAADAVIREIVAVRGDRPNGVHDWRTERDIIARAIRAERERCAKMLDSIAAAMKAVPPKTKSDFAISVRMVETMTDIAAAIRKGAA